MIHRPQGECRHCDGCGWIVDVEEVCCRRAEQECGGRGCTGSMAEQVQLQCKYCGGSGKLNEEGEQ